MGKKVNKRFVLTDDSINRYGYRVLTSGLDSSGFEKNPVLLWAHFRDSGMPCCGEQKPIGHWEDIEREDDKLTAVPYFDLQDELSKQICDKVEAGTLSAASIGFRILVISEDKADLLPGQTRGTVTKSELLECSIVDIPANAHATCGFSYPLNPDSIDHLIPLLSTPTPMKLKESMSALLAFLGISKEKASETELTDEQLTQLDGELSTLRASLAEKDAELDTLRTSHAEALSAKDAEVQSLASQVAALSEQLEALRTSSPEPPSLAPASEPLSTVPTNDEQLLSFCKDHSDDPLAIIAKARELGYLA